MPELALATLAAALAGVVDAIVGGGGLILLPALFSLYPGAAPTTLLGTNKGAAVWGTAWATAQYARRVTMNWHTLGPATGAALVGGLAGAWTVTQVPPDNLRRALPLILLAVFLYTLSRRNLGSTHAPQLRPHVERAVAAIIGAVVGFYDGFLGPGTGSFFIFLFVRALGYDFLHASAGAKLLNTATNAAALALFAATGNVAWRIALVLAAGNVAGSLLGTRLALKHGTAFVRVVFMVVVGALILRTGYDAWWK
jgi:uncharacterized membrane protein YfcA